MASTVPSNASAGSRTGVSIVRKNKRFSSFGREGATLPPRLCKKLFLFADVKWERYASSADRLSAVVFGDHHETLACCRRRGVRRGGRCRVWRLAVRFLRASGWASGKRWIAWRLRFRSRQPADAATDGASPRIRLSPRGDRHQQAARRSLPRLHAQARCERKDALRRLFHRQSKDT